MHKSPGLTAEQGKVRLGAAHWLLRIAVALYAAGLFSAVWLQQDTGVGELLARSGLNGETGRAIELTAAGLMLVGGVVVLLRPMRWLLLAMAGYALLESAGPLSSGQWWALWSPVGGALRYGSPVILLTLIAAQHAANERPLTAANWLLRVAIAAVFFAHGMEALLGEPGFVTLITASAVNLLGWSVSPETALTAMQVIGVVDLAVAAVVLLRPNRPVLAWAAFWGGITALSRVTAFGLEGGHMDALLRASHFAGPAALYVVLTPAPKHEADGPSSGAEWPAEATRAAAGAGQQTPT